MKKALVLTVMAALALLLAGCNVFEGLIPGLDPIVGTWTMTKIMVPTTVMPSSDGSWHDVSYYSMSGSTTFAGDNTYTGSFVQSGTTTNFSGTWQNDSGVYTLVQNTSGYAGVSYVTLSGDNKMAFISAANGTCEQMTK